MDKISILGDAVNYLNELKEQINDLQSEIASSSPISFMPPPTGTHIMTSTMSALPVQMKEKLCPNNVSGLKNQPTKVLIYFNRKFLFHINKCLLHSRYIFICKMKTFHSLFC
jgi:hypothetical protein